MTPKELFNSNEFALEILNYCRSESHDVILLVLSKKFGYELVKNLFSDYCWKEFLNKFDHEYDYIDDRTKVMPGETIQDQFMIYAINRNSSFIINNISLLAISSEESYYYFEKLDENEYIMWLSYIEPKDQEFYFKTISATGFQFNRIDNIVDEEDREETQTGFRFMIPGKFINGELTYIACRAIAGVTCRELNKESLCIDNERMENLAMCEKICNRFFQFGLIMYEQDVKDLLSILKDDEYDGIDLVNK